MNKFVSKSENDTIEFANNLASLLKNGDIIVLSGDLGSGKTKFTQGVLKHFGLEDEISSPTFTIVNEYNATPFDIFHFEYSFHSSKHINILWSLHPYIQLMIIHHMFLNM